MQGHPDRDDKMVQPLDDNSSWTSQRPDIVGLDRRGDQVLLAEVKSRPITDETRRQLESFMAESNPKVPYGMLVDPQSIEVVELVNGTLRDLATLPTHDVLQSYDGEFGRGRIFEDYLTSLVEAWLRDIAYSWKLSVPPGLELLQAIGLAERLRGGTTRAGVALERPALP
jgi:hypothetical protein